MPSKCKSWFAFARHIIVKIDMNSSMVQEIVAGAC